MKPTAARPEDFDAFWDRKLKALAGVRGDSILENAETSERAVLFKVQIQSLGSKVRGYLARPLGSGKFPALVIFQHAGVYALNPATVLDRAVEGWLTMNVSLS